MSNPVLSVEIPADVHDGEGGVGQGAGGQIGRHKHPPLHAVLLRPLSVLQDNALISDKERMSKRERGTGTETDKEVETDKGERERDQDEEQRMN